MSQETTPVHATPEVGPQESTSNQIPSNTKLGSEWYDADAFGRIRSYAWNQTINNTDDFTTGTILFAQEAAPDKVIDPEMPATMAAEMAKLFQQVQFEALNYEIITSKGSLTNAKFCLSFVPNMSVEEFENLSRNERLSLVDRISEKVIFSPNPLEPVSLTARWAHLTNFVRSGTSMGVVSLVLYQKVVANLAETGNSNEIQLTCRMSVDGLMLRYPVPPGVSIASRAEAELRTLLQQAPTLGVEEQDSFHEYQDPQNTRGEDVPTMVAVPAEVLNTVDSDTIRGMRKTDGTEMYHKTGYDNIFQLESRKFWLGKDDAEVEGHSHTCVLSPYTGEGPYYGTFKIRFPWTQPPNTILDFVPNSEYEMMVTLTTKNDTGYTTTTANLEINDMEFGLEGDFVILKGGYEAHTVNLINAPRGLAHVHINDFVSSLVTENFTPIEEEGHVPLYNSLPESTPPEQIVQEILDGEGLPKDLSLINQAGGMQAGRIGATEGIDSYEGKMVVESQAKGIGETIGDIVQTAESFVPLLNLFLRQEGAVVVKSSQSFPLTYVPLDQNVGGMRISRGLKKNILSQMLRSKKAAPRFRAEDILRKYNDN